MIIIIPLSRPFIGSEEIAEVTKVLKSGRLSLGERLRDFENSFAKFTGARYAVGVSSGTAGLHLCMKAIGIRDGDEVITTPFSFVASSNCILYERARPVFADIEEDTFNIDPSLIKEKITGRTRAILPVHVFGQSCDMDRIMKISSESSVPVVEDACESVGSVYRGKRTGTFGAASVFAFYPNKQMTTGEGGMVVTDSGKIREFVRSASNQGRVADSKWLLHDTIGYNYRMDEMSAALGLVQLTRLAGLIKKRQELAAMYIEELDGADGIIQPKTAKGNNHTWFVFTVRFEDGIDRDKIIRRLKKDGIETKPYFYPCIHLQPAYRPLGYKEGDFPVAERVSRSILALPFYVQMTRNDVKRVCSSLKNAMGD